MNSSSSCSSERGRCAPSSSSIARYEEYVSAGCGRHGHGHGPSVAIRRGASRRASVADERGRASQAATVAAAKAIGALAGGRDAAVRADDLQRLVALGGVERLAEQAEQLGGGHTAGLQRAQHRQRVHALDHVVPGRLAQLLLGGGDVEQVVDDLEHHPEGLAVLGERVDQSARSARRRARRCAPPWRTATPSCR